MQQIWQNLLYYGLIKGFEYPWDDNGGYIWYRIQHTTSIAPKPDYVHSMKLGIIDVNVKTRHTKLGKYEANKWLF